MNIKSRHALDRYLLKLDRGDSTVSEDAEVDPRYVVGYMLSVYKISMHVLNIPLEE